MAAKEYLGKIGQCIAHFIMPYATPIHNNAVIEKYFGISCAYPKGGGSQKKNEVQPGHHSARFFLCPSARSDTQVSGLALGHKKT